MKNRFIMISAMYENGGNVFQRHLDGHPELWVYPFESQLGTRYTSDELASVFPEKYRWPVFPLDGNVENDFELFFDEEGKTRIRRPDGSKFRDADLQIKENDRKALFLNHMEGLPRTTGNLVKAFFAATFDSWKNLVRTGKEKFDVGYSPIIGVDAEKILTDISDSIVIHVHRHPYACFAETCRRPYPLSLQRYVWTWSMVQHRALAYQAMFPERFLMVKYEDLLANKQATMERVCQQIGIKFDASLLYPSWNGQKLDNVYPWGTIDFPDANEQETRKHELSDKQRQEVALIARPMMTELGYQP